MTTGTTRRIKHDILNSIFHSTNGDGPIGCKELYTQQWTTHTHTSCRTRTRDGTEQRRRPSLFGDKTEIGRDATRTIHNTLTTTKSNPRCSSLWLGLLKSLALFYVYVNLVVLSSSVVAQQEEDENYTHTHTRVLSLLFNTTPQHYLINFHLPSSSSSLCRSQHLLTTMMGTFKADVRTRGSVFWSHFYPFHTLEHQHRVDRKFFWNTTTAGGLPTMKTTRSSLFDDEQVLGLRNEFPEEHIDFRAGGFFGTRW